MDYWYEGNLNENANRREKDGIVYYIRGVRKVNGRHMERYGVQTHFVEEGESYGPPGTGLCASAVPAGAIFYRSARRLSLCARRTQCIWRT